MTILMEVMYSHHTQNIIFGDDKQLAEKELAAIRPLLGKGDGWSNLKESEVHTINSPTGPAEVVCDRINSVRLIETNEWDRLGRPINVLKEDARINYEVRLKRALSSERRMTAPREVNAERAMHLRKALEDIRDSLRFTLSEAYCIARDAIHDDDIAIEIAEQGAFKAEDET